MKKQNLLELLFYALENKHNNNSHIPLNILIIFIVTAKMKLKVQPHRGLFCCHKSETTGETWPEVHDDKHDINNGLLSESVMHRLVAKYSSKEWVSFAQSYEKMDWW